LGTTLGCEPSGIHGIELDEGRAADLHTTFSQRGLEQARLLAPASFLGCRATSGSFSVIFLNPPFDHELGGGRRVEHTFLLHATGWLKPGGILALVCPEDVADSWEIRPLLLSCYQHITVHPFPEEVRKYREVLTLAVKRAKVVNHWEVRWNEVVEPPGRIYHIPPGGPPKAFQKVEMTEAELRGALAASPLRKLLLTPPEIPLPSPPLALGTGHIALLLAAGHLDGVVRPPAELPHVVRGTARKVSYLASSEVHEHQDGTTSTKEVWSEKIVLTVRAVDSLGGLKSFAQE
jgi:hypothetical protein